MKMWRFGTCSRKFSLFFPFFWENTNSLSHTHKHIHFWDCKINKDVSQPGSRSAFSRMSVSLSLSLSLTLSPHIYLMDCGWGLGLVRCNLIKLHDRLLKALCQSLACKTLLDNTHTQIHRDQEACTQRHTKTLITIHETLSFSHTHTRTHAHTHTDCQVYKVAGIMGCDKVEASFTAEGL